MYQYQENGFAGYRKKDCRGLPCMKCGEPSVYFSTRRCFVCLSARNYANRLKRGQKPTKYGKTISRRAK